jgi:NitT/TauT family transport system permease protein
MAMRDHVAPGSAESGAEINAELSGLDALEMVLPPKPNPLRRAWASLWPKLLAIALALGIWQLVVWSGWKPEYVIPPPGPVFRTLFDDFDEIVEGLGTTMRLAAIGYLMALIIGVIGGVAVSQSRVLRAGVGSMITGLQTMPSIVWFPLAFVLFPYSDSAVYFVIVLGAAPSIANGIIGGIDHIQPVLLRAGRVLGAKGLANLRYVVFPAAMPSFVGGLKQGWAFAWRSLLAGELLLAASGKRTLGGLLDANRNLSDYQGLIAVMIVILIIGIVIDAIFGYFDKTIRRRYGLIDAATE